MVCDKPSPQRFRCRGGSSLSGGVSLRGSRTLSLFYCSNLIVFCLGSKGSGSGLAVWFAGGETRLDLYQELRCATCKAVYITRSPGC